MRSLFFVSERDLSVHNLLSNFYKHTTANVKELELSVGILRTRSHLTKYQVGARSPKSLVIL